MFCILVIPRLSNTQSIMVLVLLNSSGRSRTNYKYHSALVWKSRIQIWPNFLLQKSGEKGDPADVGDQGMIGKIGPIGTKGEKGCKGLSGPAGGKGKAGSVCDCGRYRKFVGQLEVNVARLKTSLKFVKNVIAGIRETDEKYYYIVKEERSYRDALTHCRIRGGTLAMPRDEASNSLIADYISKSGLFRVFIGVNDVEKEGQFMYTDNTPLQNYSSWKESEPNDASGHEDCVEMLSSGAWNDVECHLTIYFVCEFMKKKKTDLQRA
ncbi:collectin-10 isoform X2 [Rhinatrema bivittatum]|uniref:collectin-10 isoform X2 n=1 Tax=Rhinatrema bivittatum TaxID=194408 RepID=UPI0011260FE0|nr:collectin-10 isoform X2 [Rhinatrema bivittatum]